MILVVFFPQIQVSATPPAPQPGTPVKVQNTMTKISNSSQIVLPAVSTANAVVKSSPEELSAAGVVDEIPPVSLPSLIGNCLCLHYVKCHGCMIEKILVFMNIYVL